MAPASTATSVTRKSRMHLLNQCEHIAWLDKDPENQVVSTAGWSYLSPHLVPEWEIRESTIGAQNETLNSAVTRTKITASGSDCCAQLRARALMNSQVPTLQRCHPEDADQIRKRFHPDTALAQPSESKADYNQDGYSTSKAKEDLGLVLESRTRALNVRGQMKYQSARSALLDPCLNVTLCCNAVTVQEDKDNTWVTQPFDRVISNANNQQGNINTAFLEAHNATMKGQILQRHLHNWEDRVSRWNQERFLNSAYASISPETYFQLVKDPLMTSHCRKGTGPGPVARQRAYNVASIGTTTQRAKRKHT